MIVTTLFTRVLILKLTGTGRSLEEKINCMLLG